ncbi:hypothetical protein Cfor_02488, partial [Coptotermes formosanus]
MELQEYTDNTKNVILVECERKVCGQRDNTGTYTNLVHSLFDKDIPVDTSLNTFIRDHANLRGTKAMCHEGGCGACIVAVRSEHPFKKEQMTYAVNSCLVSVFSCHGWAVTTVEGTGSKEKGYHPLQARLAQMNGTQCGYCSPGMVMNMYSLIEGKQVTMKEVENSFGGNICRCTGYRPILDAFKSFSVDATPDLLKQVQDIEDVYKIKICPKNGKRCSGNYNNHEDYMSCNGAEIIPRKFVSPIRLQLQGAQWFKVTKVAEIFEIFDRVGDVSYRIVAGNTGQGVYRVTEEIKVYIDVGDVAELKSLTTEPSLILGGNMSLTEAMDTFYRISEENASYKYTKALADHIDLIANVPVRNTGTIAGNLAMKHEHREFPSDVYLMLETAGATLNIGESSYILEKVNMMDFLNVDMKHKIIHSINLPQLDEDYHLRTFKIMPRAQNAHAYVNAGFLFKMKIHASNTESYLKDKNLFDHEVFRTALKMLDAELHPDHVLPDASPEYRKGLAAALFYKFVLGLSPPDLPANLVSGGKILERPLSTGKQDYETNECVWPLNKPVPKLEAVVQCSGEAQYVNDIPTMPSEVYAAFCLTTVGQGYITNIDASEILDIPGIVAFLSAKDIPGKNSFIPVGILTMVEDEEIFCSGEIKYAGQPFGLVVANSQKLAHHAALKVKVEYSNVRKPVIDLREIIASGNERRVTAHREPGYKPQVDKDIPVDTSLNTFIRDHANLRGTKAMCHEGGCGACIVAVRSEHPFKKEQMTYAVNSCLVSVFSCHGWAVTTVEGIGSKDKGYHPLQACLAKMNGTQCGYCSPGMVMNMYSLIEGKQVTMKEVENSFGGNICRCTGYRPILDAFKSFSVDAPPDLLTQVQDIEDVYKIKICPKSGKRCSGNCSAHEDYMTCNGAEIIPRKVVSPIHLQLQGAQWFKVTKVEEIFEIFDKVGDVSYRIVAGNTGQ